MIPTTIRHIEQYGIRWMIVVAEDSEGVFVNAFHIRTLEAILIEARGFPSIDNAIETARRMIENVTL